jgi:ribosome-binding factor A
MASQNARLRRVGEQLKRELAGIIHDELKDPRLGMVTVSAVRVSRDLGHAKVYITVLGEESRKKESVEVLNHAGRFLRKSLGQCLKLRAIPELHFVYDESLEKGMHLTNLIEQAVASDSRSAHKDD